MLRRSHKKTKKGTKCEECRRRHIRCDQQRPSCINCQTSDRVCIYRPTGQPRAVDASLSSNTSSNHDTPPPPPSRTPDDSLVNIVHLDLFNHFIQGTFLFIDRDTTFTDQLKKTALSSAFSNPYLMHGILAFSARHISTQVFPERSHFYLNQSTELQAWAVANFNPAPREPDQDKCVALVLFSSLICIHGLTDIAPLNLHPEPFFIRFGHYFGLHRGVRAIIGDYQSRLKGSEIQHLVEWCKLRALEKGQGPECDACHHAIELLQFVLDGCTPHQKMPVYCVYLTLAWPLLVDEKLVDLLVLRRPVALIIFAYYGVILDLCRDLWMVGQAGKQIIHAVNAYLGSNWASLLRWPCDAVSIETI
ncbi:hypothetical protein F4823DRAFT_623968 [Ustulina deusta]|nr:hypothetical protein F4823DRAFT_623968 [Ustulina deusta]